MDGLKGTDFIKTSDVKLTSGGTWETYELKKNMNTEWLNNNDNLFEGFFSSLSVPPTATTSSNPQPSLHTDTMSPARRSLAKSLSVSIFSSAYDDYIYNAAPNHPQLDPSTCSGGAFPPVPITYMTMIDAMDTLGVMGNWTEFARAVERLRVEDNKRGGRDGGGIFADNVNSGAGGCFGSGLGASPSL